MTLSRIQNFLAVVPLFAMAPVVQAQQFLELFPGTASYNILLGGVGVAGELLQGFAAGQNRGLGDQDCTCSVDVVRVVVQDQNAATADPYRIVLRSGTDASGPGATAADYLGGGPFGPFVAPPGVGPVQFVLTHTFATAVAIPCEGFFAAGVEGTRPSSTTNDGLGVIGCSGADTVFVFPDVQKHHANAPATAFGMLPVNGTVSPFSADRRTLRIAVGFANAPVLQAANVDTSTRFGSGGYFPDTALSGAASQGLAVRCFDPLGAGGSMVGLVQIAGFGPQSVISGFTNCLYLSTVVPPIPFLGVVTDGTPLTLVPPGLDLLPSLGGIPVAIQGVVLPTMAFTNAVSVTLF